MPSLASQLSSRRLARTEARIPALAQPGNSELKGRVCSLIDRDEHFAKRLRTFVDQYEAENVPVHIPPDDGAEAEAEAARRNVAAQEASGKCIFNFVDADYLRSLPDDAPPLPPLQQILRETPNAIVQRTIDVGEAYRAAYVDEFLAISHRWERPDVPDGEGVQLRAVCAHVRSRSEIKAVWYDHWSMSQDERSTEEKEAGTRPDTRSLAMIVHFKHMLKNVNLLYLGMRVLVLADISYLSRFWVCAAASDPWGLARLFARTQTADYRIRSCAARVLRRRSLRRGSRCARAARRGLARRTRAAGGIQSCACTMRHRAKKMSSCARCGSVSRPTMRTRCSRSPT